jgi:GYF domain 2
MSDRSWFFAANGQQQGPYPEAQFRDFVARGTVRPETLVWSEGMAGWQKAGEIPGLFSSGAAPTLPRGGAAAMGGGSAGGGQLSIELGLWAFLGRSILFVIGMLLVIPAPWVAVSYYRWVASRITVPGRPNFAFTGQVGDIWYVFVLLALCSYGGSTGRIAVQLIVIVLQAFLSWMILRWIATNLSSNGQQLPITFEGSPLIYVGWHLLMYVSFITIVGWAWVITAWMRWNCRNVRGTRRDIAFKASGLDVLWRTIVFAVACVFLIPIPWVLRWYTQWYVSQFELEPQMAGA